MSIQVMCACGSVLRAKEEDIGKRARCPACGGGMLIPAPVPTEAPAFPQRSSWSFLRLGLVLGVSTAAAMAIVGVIVVAGFRYATKNQVAQAASTRPTATTAAQATSPQTTSPIPATERTRDSGDSVPPPPPTTPQKQAPAPPAKPVSPPPPPRKRPSGPPLDIRESMKKAGYSSTMTAATLESFARFGTAERGSRFQRGDQFDRIEIGKEVREHQDNVRKQAFAFKDMEIIVPTRQEEFETKGLLVQCKLPLRIESWPRDEEPTMQGLFKFHLCRVDTRQTWFLTKEKTLLPCNTAEEIRLLKQRNAIFYHPEAKTTDLIMFLSVDAEVGKAVSRGAKNYVVDLVVEGLKYEEVTTWGYFNRQSLVEDDWDSESIVRPEEVGLTPDVPGYFRVDMRTMPKVVMGELLSATLRDKTGKDVASFNR